MLEHGHAAVSHAWSIYNTALNNSGLWGGAHRSAGTWPCWPCDNDTAQGTRQCDSDRGRAGLEQNNFSRSTGHWMPCRCWPSHDPAETNEAKTRDRDKLKPGTWYWLSNLSYLRCMHDNIVKRIRPTALSLTLHPGSLNQGTKGVT